MPAHCSYALTKNRSRIVFGTLHSLVSFWNCSFFFFIQLTTQKAHLSIHNLDIKTTYDVSILSTNVILLQAQQGCCRMALENFLKCLISVILINNFTEIKHFKKFSRAMRKQPCCAWSNMTFVLSIRFHVADLATSTQCVNSNIVVWLKETL